MDIIATIGPSAMSEARVSSLVEAGVTIFRINGAHASADCAAEMVTQLRRFTDGRARSMIDLPTNKIRTANLAEPIVFGPGETFTLYDFQFNYPRLCEVACVGDEVIVNNGMNHLMVTDVNERMIEFRADAAGQIGTNRGLIFTREIHTPDFPFFFPKDLELIAVINDLKVELVGLSFVRYPTDKQAAKEHIKDPQSLMYKIETRKAFSDYETLFEPGERILIDRGDLAGEIGLLNIPQAQDRLIRFAHRQRIEVYLATQFLAAMEHSPIPHIAEVCALYETIKLGISGIQLSEETAVGRHPVKAVRCIREIEQLVVAEGRLRFAG